LAFRSAMAKGWRAKMKGMRPWLSMATAASLQRKSSPRPVLT